MPESVHQNPMNPDKRSRLEKLLGKEYHPHFKYSDSRVREILSMTLRQNMENTKRWRGRIGKVTLK